MQRITHTLLIAAITCLLVIPVVVAHDLLTKPEPSISEPPPVSQQDRNEHLLLAANHTVPKTISIEVPPTIGNAS